MRAFFFLGQLNRRQVDLIGPPPAQAFLPDELGLHLTDSIQDSIRTDSNLFPFKTKGILLASSQYEVLERGRIKIMPENPEIEGILDGGHNTLAIGLYILERALSEQGEALPRGAKTWDQFKSLWEEKL